MSKEIPYTTRKVQVLRNGDEVILEYMCKQHKGFSDEITAINQPFFLNVLPPTCDFHLMPGDIVVLGDIEITIIDTSTQYPRVTPAKYQGGSVYR